MRERLRSCPVLGEVLRRKRYTADQAMHAVDRCLGNLERFGGMTWRFDDCHVVRLGRRVGPIDIEIEGWIGCECDVKDHGNSSGVITVFPHL
jgi:hypothetical protein